jgi:hypothetical protein
VTASSPESSTNFGKIAALAQEIAAIITPPERPALATWASASRDDGYIGMLRLLRSTRNFLEA